MSGHPRAWPPLPRPPTAFVASGPVDGERTTAPLGPSGISLLSSCLVVSLAFIAPALAQSNFDSWTTENGLPQNSVNDIAQTRDGYLWLATYGGLVRFDGTRFVVFDRSVEGIKSQRVRRIHEDRSGTLWAATEEGMLIRYSGGRFTTFAGERGLPRANVLRIEESDDGSLWITSLDTITKFDGERAVSYRPSDFTHGVSAPPHDKVFDRWWSHDPGGLHVLINGQVQSFAVGRDVLGGEVTGVTRDRAGNLWVRTEGAGVVKIGREGIKRYGTREWRSTDEPFPSFQEDRHGNVWAAAGNRVYRIRNGTRELKSESGLLAFFEDSEGSTWLGTNEGLHRVRDFSVTLYTEREGLSSNWVYTILQSRRGAIWVGTWGGGVNRYENGRFTAFRQADGLPSDRIAAIYEDPSGRLWIGTSHGISYFEKGRLKRYRDSSGLLDGTVCAIYQDRDGSLWFGTELGLVRLAEGRFTRYTVSAGLSNDRVSTLFEDRSGTLWIGTAEGLTRYRSGSFRRYDERDGLVGTHVRAIHEDPDGVLWIGTYDGGLYRLAGDRLTRYTREHGLHDNGVFQILEDSAGYLWMGSNRGISRVSRRELNDIAEGRSRAVTAIVVGTKDGLLSVEVNGGRQPAGLKTADGRLWFPTMGGVAVVDPAALRINTRPPATVLEEVRVAGQAVDFAGRVTILPDAPSFEIRYTAPSFINPEQVRFRYRLVGLDEEWIDAGDRRTATYHRIPPGEYRFWVMAANHHGVWNSDSQGVDIVVVPPFWRTWWFVALSVAATFSIGLAGHERRVRRVRREHAVQTAFSQQLIDSQESERRRISNEMHDSLGQHLAIIRQRARTGLERATDRDGAKTFDEIVGVADRIDAEVKEIAYGLRPYQLDRIGLSKTITTMVQRVADASGIECVVDIAPVDEAFPKDEHIHVYRIVQESLNNVIKHSKASRATVIISRDDRFVAIRVEDDGEGFRPDAVSAGASTTSGFGLQGIRERARILGGKVDIRSTSGIGTSVKVTVPIGPTHE